MPSIVSAPLRFRDRRLDTYQPTTTTARAALDAARRFANGGHRYLVLTGPTGVGKTHLAAGAAALRHEVDDSVWLASPEYAAHRTRVEAAAPWERIRPPRATPAVPDWQNVVDLIVGLREDMGRPMDDKEWEFRPGELRNHPGVVVLDDLGREKVSDWTGETVYGIVNHRYEAMLPTIVTTNLTGAELAASPYWPAISRLAEDGALIRIEAPDHRLRVSA
jgi:DNA replication protein DnaC